MNNTQRDKAPASFVNTDLEASLICNAAMKRHLMASILPDNSVAALDDHDDVRVILMGCTMTGHGREFEFKDKQLATRQFLALKSVHDNPKEIA